MTQYSGKVIRKTPVTPTQQSASGVWKLNEQAAAIRNNSWPVPGVPDPISRSVRLRSSASAYLNRTFGTPTAQNTWTLSFWTKRGSLGSLVELFSAGTSNRLEFLFAANNTFQIADASTNFIITSAVFRDPSAWYHIVVRANGSGSALQVYVNGVVTTNSTTNNLTTSYWNASGTVGYIGALGGFSSNYYDGYLTEINFIDGQALTASSFGTTDTATGAWIPMPYTGTYGANGFYLNFKDNTSTTTIGYDYSGNANNWTANNISLTSGSTYDSMLDVPTPWVGYSTTTDTSAVTRGNYATMNSLAVGPYATLSDGNLKISGASATDSSASYSTIGMTTGKWYFEVTNTGSGYGASTFGYALVADVLNAQALLQTSFAGYRTRGNTYGTVTSTFATWEAGGEVIGVAVDCDNGAIYFARNNTWINSGDPTSGASKTGAITTYTGGSKTLYGGGGVYSTSSQNVTLNFGQRPFAYTPPTGFKALVTTNLPTPTITNGANYMAASTYTGNGSTQSIVNSGNNTAAISFQPDFVWIKDRSAARSHRLFDSVRGATKALFSDATDAETTLSTDLTAFNSNGFALGAGLGSNANTETFVGWQWKASGTTSSNTSGSITSTVSVNTTAGFSVVTYTGTGSAATVGHGLGVAPSMVIVKQRAGGGTSGVNDWVVSHASLTSGTYFIRLNTTAAQQNASTVFSAFPSSTVINIGNDSYVNASSGTYVAYCWAAVAGYSAFGSYTGNGSTDGPFVYLGFRPRWLMIKRSSSASVTYGWQMYDTSRQPVNTASSDPNLWADTSAAEGTGNYTFDLLSNGFKLRSSGVNENASGDTYIYAAFAENPFKYSNAR